MSLENEIKELRASIITLTEVIANMQNAATTVEVGKAEKKKKSVETVTEQESSTKSKTVVATAKTHEDLKATCLKVARAADGNKAKVKAVLADYYAVKASDVPSDKIAEVIEKVEAI
ncbi:coil containing protein [Vibrio phage 1.017.O._10N.286.55.C11]|nr:coil containing protein [Vibrio phage 1.017.O._10N.286.55.C11]AUR85502.1 coil containing protein [Vibrio phage 1.075.O._10N.286.55.B10]AUR87048.1 coil containing protein [Vibrio phage 1.093.O._10N.286.55.E10]AUR87121.1 coil containing protein [Vibrio phage 1.094.O._10N.286.55.E12]